MHVGGGGLPSVYQAVEWIGARGTQYLKTKVSASSNVDLYVEFMPVTGNTGDNVLFGSANGTSAMYWCDIYSNTVYWRYATTVSGNLVILSWNAWHTTNTIKNVIYIDGTIKLTVPNNPFAVPEPYDKFWIFALNRSGTPLICKGINIRKFTLTDNTTNKELFNGIPCYRKSDGVIGMYDLVSEQFLTNQGTGTFTKGADI